MRKNIPNIITLVNLFCGCCALVCVFKELFVLTFFFILMGGIADYTDGLVARMMGVNSPLGKEMDSLADMVSFGVVPGAILYQLLVLSGVGDAAANDIEWLALPGFLFSVFAGLRLARFNLDTRQSEDFIGMPTPSCTMFIVGLMLIYEMDSAGLRSWVLEPALLYGTVVLFSFLLVSELPMFSFKFKGLRWKGNEQRITFLLLALASLAILREITFSLLILLYVLYSIIVYFFKRNRNEVLSGD